MTPAEVEALGAPAGEPLPLALADPYRRLVGRLPEPVLALGFDAVLEHCAALGEEEGASLY